MLLLGAWLSIAAAESQLVITSDRAVVVFVNLKPYPIKGGSKPLVVDFPNGKEGDQRVAVRSATSELLWTGVIDVPSGQRVHGEFIQRHLEVSPPEPLNGMRKLSQEGLYNVDGEWTTKRPAAVAVDEPEPEPARKKDDVYLEAVSAAATADGVGVPAPAQPGEMARPGPGGQGVLRLANRSTSWANVVVDGAVIEFRGERDRELSLASGAHVVEIRDFRQQLLFWGTAWVWPDETIELQFSATAAPAVPERPEAWILRPPPEEVVP
jgi:hypothetical protein